VLNIDIRTKGGERIADKWLAGPRTYLGLMTAGFPDLLLITGPGSPRWLTNMVGRALEHAQVFGLARDLRDHLNARGAGADHADPLAAGR
jgi:cyclohexanone monooxygenase